MKNQLPKNLRKFMGRISNPILDTTILRKSRMKTIMLILFNFSDIAFKNF